MLNGVQAIRAWAAIAVMVFHLGEALTAPKYFGLNDPAVITEFGRHGVLVFFVLSGFIIHHIHGKDIGRPKQLSHYLFRRVMRIYPAYWVPLLLVAGFAWISGIGDEGLPTDSAGLVKMLLLVPQDPTVVFGGTGAPVLIVAWSLQYEMLFYIAFALCIVNLRFGLTVAIGFIGMLIWLQNHGVEHVFPSWMSYVEFVLFAMGIIVSRGLALPVGEGTARLAWRFALVLLLLAWGTEAGIGLFSAGEIKLFNGSAERLALGLLAMLLIGSRAVLDLRQPAPTAVLTRYLAECSYLIYLVHYPVISAACKIVLALGFDGIAGAALASIIAVVGTLSLAAILHEAVEKPVAAFVRRAERPHASVST